jgi:hypothetical protein
MYGCGNIDHTITMVMGLFRWTGSSAQSFCAEIIRASTLHFLQSFQLRITDPLGLQVWSSFIYGAVSSLCLLLIILPNKFMIASTNLETIF